MRLPLLAVLLLLLPAWLMLPLQGQILAERRQLKYGGVPVTRELRDQIGQGLAIALLAGFRGIAADFVWIRSHGYWEQRMWLKQTECIENTVKLQPQSTYFWDLGAWHMAWNIGYAERVATDNVTQAQGILRERYWHERARVFLERGVQNVPHRYDLFFKLGYLYEQKLIRDCGSDAACEKEHYRKIIEYVTKAASFDEAPPYVARHAAACMERSGDKQGAYEYWRSLWPRENLRRTNFDRTVMEREIRRLEDSLKIPDTDRLFSKPRALPTTAS